MKIANMIGVVLIIGGVIGVSYPGITYTSDEKVAEIGSVKITNQTEKTIPFSPVAGGLCIAIGIGLIIFSRLRP